MTILINPFRFAAAAGLHWIELGRTTLGSTGDDITVSSLANKPYLMALGYKISSGNSDFVWRVGNGSADSGNNYARRCSSNGGGDTTNAPHDAMFGDNGGYSNPSFQVGYFTNIAAQEKLNITHSVGQNTAGAGNAPIRRESVSKWVNTSDVIDVIQGHNQESGDYASGSEVVVLGYDPDDTEGGSVWEELASVVMGSNSSSGISTGTFTAKRYLWIQGWLNGTADGGTYSELTFNSDTGNNYAFRSSMSGASDVSNDTQPHMRLHGDQGGDTHGILFNAFIINKSDKEKLIMTETTQGSAAGAGTAPFRYEAVGKWINTSSQITSMNIKFNTSTMASGSSIKVWGFD